MLEDERQQIEAEEKFKIHAETAKVVWKEIELFYAKGAMIYVHPELDLIKVAFHLSHDNTQQIEQWIEQEMILRSFDEQATHWADSQEEIWSVVVKPWVLVQAVKQTIN